MNRIFMPASKGLVILIFSFISINVFAQAAKFLRPKVAVNISLNKKAFHKSDSISVDIVLTNKTNQKQVLFLGSPSEAPAGPWRTAAEIIDVKTGKSAIVEGNRSRMNSHISFENEFRKEIYYLPVGKSKLLRYNIKQLVIFNWLGEPLPKGNYQLQVFYSGNSSNKVRFQII